MDAAISKWAAVVASIWIQCSCGASYAFGIYSPLLKSSQGYDQSTLDTISVFKDIGANVGVLSGILYSAVNRPGQRSHFRGPWMVHAAGAIQCFAGYFFIWLAVTGAIPRPQVPFMYLFMFLAAHAQTFFNTANVVTAVHNFPNYSGTIVGIMKGFLGISGAVLIQFYQTLFKGEPSTFLLMLALLPTLLSLVLMCFVRVHHAQSKDEKGYLNGFSLISLIVAAYIMFLIIVDIVLSLSQWMRSLTLAVLFIILSSPLYILFKAHEDASVPTLCSSTTPLLNDPESIEPAEKPTEIQNTRVQLTVTTSKDSLNFGEELNPIQAMQTLNFWLLFIAMMCGMGSGLATINNMSQIGESLGYTEEERSALVSLWSIWNFLGRFGAGYVSDIFMHRKGWARPLFMTLTLATMTAGHLIIGSGFPGNLYIGSVLVGICYGSQWSLMPTITCEIFGIQHMGTIFNTIAIASPLGSYVLSVRIIGNFYDREGSRTGQHMCSGTQCFMLSFFILACVSFFGFLVASCLLIKTRGIYIQIARGRRVVCEN
ncbi:protein NUCLEAR FUSION DEFECTIVE 4-like [Primulina tabacum]|uniref:protein NUCLEAR FUSION DEFECTIVE 4-like n=1 Tax=Primulina tabacum TaxID=48773 RepID=UPI003F598577